MESDVEDMIKKIVSQAGKKEAEVRELIEKKKEAMSGLLTDYGAVYGVAKDLGVDLDRDSGVELNKISGVKSGSVSIAGRVKSFIPQREFPRKDGTVGKIARIVLKDDTGEIGVVLWDAHSEIAKNLKFNDLVMVKFGNAKGEGVTEVHSTAFTIVSVNPDINISIPEIKEEFVKSGKIKDLTEKHSVNMLLRVSSNPVSSEFQRSDGTTGNRFSFIGEDEEGRVRVVVWDKVSDLNVSDVFKIRGYIKKNLFGDMEVHVSSKDGVEKTSLKLNLAEIKREFIKVNKILPDSNVSFESRIMKIFEKKDYTGGKFASLVVGDETGSIRVVLWNEKSDFVDGVKEGDAVKIEEGFAKLNLGVLEVHIRKYSGISLIKDSKLPGADELKSALVKEKKIADIGDNERDIKITGKVVDIDTTQEILYKACPKCKRKLQEFSGEWHCEFCGMNVEPSQNLKLRVFLSDDSPIQVLFFGKVAEKFLGISVNDILNLSGEMGERTLLEKTKADLMDKNISVIGHSKYNDRFSRVEFLADDILK